MIVDRGEKAKGQGDRGELGKEVETANEVGSYREQKVYILNSLDR